MMKDMEEKKEAMEQEENQELDFEELEQVTGGTIGFNRPPRVSIGYEPGIGSTSGIEVDLSEQTQYQCPSLVRYELR